MLACVEAGDLSPLSPLSVKDLIWVRMAQLVRRKEGFDLDMAEREGDFKAFDAIALLLADIRQILLQSNFYNGVAAFKESAKAMRSFHPVEIDQLPSMQEARRQEEERRAKMTPEERREQRIKDFLDGKKYVPE